MSDIEKKKEICLDPRTKIILIFLCVLSSMFLPSLQYELIFISLISFTGILFGKWRYSIGGFLFYGLVYIFTLWVMTSMSGILRTSLVAFLGLFHKVYPCGMLSGIIISTTKVSEFMSSMNKIHIPKNIVIPIAIMLRYLPAVREDWRYIKDAMIMRDVSPTFKGFITNPWMTINCIYVPLMMSASKTADELSIAAITRGIENPKPRTCIVQVGFHLIDGLIIILFLAFLILSVYWKGSVE